MQINSHLLVDILYQTKNKLIACNGYVEKADMTLHLYEHILNGMSSYPYMHSPYLHGTMGNQKEFYQTLYEHYIVSPEGVRALKQAVEESLRLSDLDELL